MTILYENEIWIDLKGYEGLYQISSYGRLRSFYKKNGRTISDNSRLLKGKIDKDGYMEYTLSKDKKHKCKRAHRLVAEMFIINEENKPQINHIDGNKLNNHFLNLEWVTTSENCKHKYEIGLGELAKEVASVTHGRRCKLTHIETGEVYDFNSLSKASLFLGKRNRWLKDISRKASYINEIYKMGYHVEMEDSRTYEQFT